MAATLITGASSGIGRALAVDLARTRHDLVLVGRDEKALASAREDCLRAGSPEVWGLAFDLALPDSSARVQAALAEKGIQVEILINNAGIGVHGEFADTALERELELVHVQIDTMLALTKALLPGMLARGMGRILNVSSVYSFAPVSRQAVYGASKAFMLSFSEALAYELKGSGVTVTVLCPGSTKTDFRRRSGVDTTGGMDPAVVARFGIAAMEAGRFLAVPGLHNVLFTIVMKHLPHSLRAPLMQFINARRGLYSKSSDARVLDSGTPGPDPRHKPDR